MLGEMPANATDAVRGRLERRKLGTRPYTEAVWRDEQAELECRFPRVTFTSRIRSWIQALWYEPWHGGHREVVVTAETPAELAGKLEGRDDKPG